LFGDSAFLYPEYRPSVASEQSGDSEISLFVGLDFVAPEFFIALRQALAGATVPKTAVDKNS